MPYSPDTVSTPGETLNETLEVLGISQAELARRIGRPDKTISEIIHARTAITPETARQFEYALGVPAEFWNAREANYRASLAAKAEQERLQQQLRWLAQFPLVELARRNVIDRRDSAVDNMRSLLGFFGIGSPEQFEPSVLAQQTHFRKSPKLKSNAISLAIWLRMGEITAQSMRLARYDKPQFKLALEKCRLLTRQPDPMDALKSATALAAHAGVAVVVVPEIRGCRASGATRWVNGQWPMLLLSLRHKRDDHLWFSLFHEAAHILFHPKDNTFVEGPYVDSSEEIEANAFAQEMLIPQTEFLDWVERCNDQFPDQAIHLFAQKVGVSASIVAGRLKHERLMAQSRAQDLHTRIVAIDFWLPDNPSGAK